MGFGSLSLDFYSTGEPGTPERIDIVGRNDNDDDWVKRAENIAKAQARFDKDKFYSVSWKKPGKAVRMAATAKLELPLEKMSVDVPLLDEEQPGCCKWMVKTSEAKNAEGLKLIHAYGDCGYKDEPGNACHIDGYNEESYSFEERYFLSK